MDLPCIYLFVLWISTTFAEEDWTRKCDRCLCIWSSGKRTANCAGQNYSKIPSNLSESIREIDFSNNPLYTLDKYEFRNANLANIHKLKLQNCNISQVNQWAFSHLALLIELDISRNEIGSLNRNVFHDTSKLRILILSHNKLKELDDGLFYNLTHLQQLFLADNEIETISPSTFQDLPSLTHLILSHNRIQRITFDLKADMPKLSSISVDENPWICDCYLKEFREKSIKMITTPIICQNPPRLKGRTWQENIVFACAPQVVDTGPSSIIEVTSSNVTLTCKVSGDPTPDVDWMTNGMIIERDPRKSKQKYVTFKNTESGYTWNNLTITNVSYRDRGDYKCIAKNPGGEDERNVTLVYAGPISGGGTGALTTNTYLIIGLCIAAIIVLLIILLLLFCFCKKSMRGLNTKGRNLSGSSEEYIHMSGGQPEIKKGLITDVNPVTKPPRASVPPSLVSGGTEVSDAKKNLLDNDSVFDCDEESRSLDFDQTLSRKSQMLLDSEYSHYNPYPPDLLPFPLREAQVSPAASSASTVADTTRLPPHHGPQSPLQSPIYDQLNLYRTLPYSRSYSPFVGPAAKLPRQGYVTIPRRPRQQSWSSEPPNVSDLIAEPLYDNLGLRTTADGGTSTLSLNKLENLASPPRSNKMFSPNAAGCDPIAESREFLPSQTSSQTLPRLLHSNKLTPSKTHWAKANAAALQSPERRNSTTSLPLPDSQSKPTKIPPRPPPKPKKRLSTGPLFEDEGEDGTEV